MKRRQSQKNSGYIRIIYIILVVSIVLQLLGVYRRVTGEALLDMGVGDSFNSIGIALLVALFILAPLMLWCVWLYKLEKEGRGVKYFWFWVVVCCCVQAIPLSLAVTMDMKEKDMLAMFSGSALGQGAVWYIIMKKVRKLD